MARSVEGAQRPYWRAEIKRFLEFRGNRVAAGHGTHYVMLSDVFVCFIFAETDLCLKHAVSFIE